MPRPRHDRLDSTSSSTPLLPMLRSGSLSFSEESVPGKLDERSANDPVWKKYVDKAREFDNKMIDEWNKFLDVTLVFNGLFIAVLTSFIIEISKSFKPDPVEVADQILVLIFNKLSNSSSGPEKLDFAEFKVEKEELSAVILHNGLLFVSLALSIAVSMISMAAKIWLVRYIFWVCEPGSDYDRAMKRQQSYSGIQRWKLHRVIDSLPLWTLIAVFLFGLFIHQTIRDRHPILGYTVGVIFLIGFTFFVLASCSAAFIPSAPFQSPFSHFIAFISKQTFPVHRGRRLGFVVISSIIMAFVTIVLVAYKNTIWQLLIFYPIAGSFAVAGEQDPTNNYSPLYGPPELVVLGGFTLFVPIAVALYVDTTRDPGRTIYIVVSSVGAVLLALYGYAMNRLTQKVPDTLEAEAIAWFLELSWSKESESELFEKANSIANTPQRKALLLHALLPHLSHLIASRVRNPPGELGDGDDLQTFLSHLENLLHFPESERSYWRNEAAVRRPDGIGDHLAQLRGSPDPRIRQAAEAMWRRIISSENEKAVDRA